MEQIFLELQQFKPTLFLELISLLGVLTALYIQTLNSRKHFFFANIFYSLSNVCMLTISFLFDFYFLLAMMSIYTLSSLNGIRTNMDSVFPNLKDKKNIIISILFIFKLIIVYSLINIIPNYQEIPQIETHLHFFEILSFLIGVPAVIWMSYHIQNRYLWIAFSMFTFADLCLLIFAFQENLFLLTLQATIAAPFALKGAYFSYINQHIER